MNEPVPHRIVNVAELIVAIARVQLHQLPVGERQILPFAEGERLPVDDARPVAQLAGELINFVVRPGDDRSADVGLLSAHANR